jgi:hypothetical protein
MCSHLKLAHQANKVRSVSLCGQIDLDIVVVLVDWIISCRARPPNSIKLKGCDRLRLIINQSIKKIIYLFCLQTLVFYPLLFFFVYAMFKDVLSDLSISEQP